MFRFWKKKVLLGALGYDFTHWVRYVQYQEMFAYVRALPVVQMDALEISGGKLWRESFAWRSFTEAHFPAYDVCAGPLGQRFDVVIMDHVLPHVLHPQRACANVLAMLKPGGHFLVSSSFLIHINQMTDCSRWSAMGLRHLLLDVGFPEETIVAGAWGNLSAVKVNLTRLGEKRGWFRSLDNDPKYPTTTWAMARAPS